MVGSELRMRPTPAPPSYWRYVVSHPGHAVLLGIIVVPGATMLDWPLVGAGLLFIELAIVFIVPRLRWTRRLADAHFERRASEIAAEARRGLLERMSEAHRRELLELEGVAGLVRERCGLEADAADAVGVEQLIELYVRLGIAHRAATSSLDAVGRAHPEGALRHLEEQMRGAPEVVREVMDRRRSILLLRCETRQKALQRRAAIGQALAAIADTLRWMHEHCTALPSYELLRRELEVALGMRERDVATLLELAELRDDDFDGSVLARGRPRPERGCSERVRIAPMSDEGLRESAARDLDDPIARESGRRA